MAKAMLVEGDVDAELDRYEVRFWTEPGEGGGVVMNGSMPSLTTQAGAKLVRVADVVALLEAYQATGASCVDAARFLTGMMRA